MKYIPKRFYIRQWPAKLSISWLHLDLLYRQSYQNIFCGCFKKLKSLRNNHYIMQTIYLQHKEFRVSIMTSAQRHSVSLGIILSPTYFIWNNHLFKTGEYPSNIILLQSVGGVLTIVLVKRHRNKAVKCYICVPEELIM